MGKAPGDASFTVSIAQASGSSQNAQVMSTGVQSVSTAANGVNTLTGYGSTKVKGKAITQ